MVDGGEVNHLEGEWLLAEVVQRAEGDIEPDAPQGYDPIERCLAGVQVVVQMPIMSRVLA